MSRATVFMLATSDPLSGSVIPKKPIWVPATHPGMNFCFCASVPNFATVSAGPRFCKLNGSRQDADTLAICSAIKTDSMNPKPVPPSSSGTPHEKKPNSPILATRSSRNSWFFSSSTSVGAMSFRANSRAVSWTSFCSSVSSKIIYASSCAVTTALKGLATGSAVTTALKGLAATQVIRSWRAGRPRRPGRPHLR